MFVASGMPEASSSSEKPEETMLGKTVLITGSTSGIGLHAAKRFYSMGASVVITFRDAEKGKAAVEAVLSSATPAEEQSLMMLDLTSAPCNRWTVFAERRSILYASLTCSYATPG
ncbi:unnamed protein product, partial [Mesorhabditis spiculigera]